MLSILIVSLSLPSVTRVLVQQSHVFDFVNLRVNILHYMFILFSDRECKDTRRWRVESFGISAILVPTSEFAPHCAGKDF